jgi:Family of unknown function (DUF5335)
MQTYEIPREQWPMAVTSFGEQHRRWRVSVDVLGPEIGAQPEVKELPLEGLSAEPPADGGSISIFLERSVDDHVTHLIEKPVSIRVAEDNNGLDLLQIAAADGTTTIVTFAPPAALPQG